MPLLFSGSGHPVRKGCFMAGNYGIGFVKGLLPGLSSAVDDMTQRRREAEARAFQEQMQNAGFAHDTEMADANRRFFKETNGVPESEIPYYNDIFKTHYIPGRFNPQGFGPTLQSGLVNAEKPEAPAIRQPAGRKGAARPDPDQPGDGRPAVVGGEDPRRSEYRRAARLAESQ